MSDNASDRGKEKGKGTDGDDSEYLIDETVSVDRDDPFEYWDIPVDPSEDETWVIRAIGRTDKTEVKAYILPEEEVEFLKSDEDVWWEYRSGRTKRLQDSINVSHEDEKPYYHQGDYVLAVIAEPKKRENLPEEPKFSVKFRRE